jgi:hypothetical protein
MKRKTKRKSPWYFMFRKEKAKVLDLQAHTHVLQSSVDQLRDAVARAKTFTISMERDLYAARLLLIESRSLTGLIKQVYFSLKCRFKTHTWLERPETYIRYSNKVLWICRGCGKYQLRDGPQCAMVDSSDKPNIEGVKTFKQYRSDMLKTTKRLARSTKPKLATEWK